MFRVINVHYIILYESGFAHLRYFVSLELKGFSLFYTYIFHGATLCAVDTSTSLRKKCPTSYREKISEMKPLSRIHCAELYLSSPSDPESVTPLAYNRAIADFI